MDTSFNQQERLILSDDDAKVNEQDNRVNNDFILFSKEVYKDFDCTLNYVAPKSLYAPYDLAMAVRFNKEPFNGKYGYAIEIKERQSHYNDSYMIDVPKIEKLKGIAEKHAVNVRLVVQEPVRDKVYVFNVNNIDWGKVKREWKNVRATTTRSYTDVRVDKEFYMLDWELARDFNFTGWSDETLKKFAQ